MIDIHTRRFEIVLPGILIRSRTPSLRIPTYGKERRAQSSEAPYDTPTLTRDRVRQHIKKEKQIRAQHDKSEYIGVYEFRKKAHAYDPIISISLPVQPHEPQLERVPECKLEK